MIPERQQRGTSIRFARRDSDARPLDLTRLLHRALEHDNSLIGADCGYLGNGSPIRFSRYRCSRLCAFRRGDSQSHRRGIRRLELIGRQHSGDLQRFHGDHNRLGSDERRVLG